MKIAVFSTKSYDRQYLDEANQAAGHELFYFETSLNQKTARLSENFEGVCIFVNDYLNRSTIATLATKNIRLIALRCAGFNNVDINSATKYKMRILRVPAYSPHAVAEHAVALILTLNRKTHKAYNRVKELNFSLERLTGFDLYGKTIGVIGTGRIGAVFCEIMRGFGCRIIAHDKFPSAKLIVKGVEYKKLPELLSKSDIISLHCPLTPDTKYIINQKTLNMVKNGAMLINTSRGMLVDTKAVIAALKVGKLGYFGLDVYEQEENLFFRDLSETIIQDDNIARLMSFPNVLITAHQAFFTNTALRQIAATTIKNISDCESGLASPNQVTTDMVK